MQQQRLYDYTLTYSLDGLTAHRKRVTSCPCVQAAEKKAELPPGALIGYTASPALTGEEWSNE